MSSQLAQLFPRCSLDEGDRRGLEGEAQSLDVIHQTLETPATVSWSLLVRKIYVRVVLHSCGHFLKTKIFHCVILGQFPDFKNGFKRFERLSHTCAHMHTCAHIHTHIQSSWKLISILGVVLLMIKVSLS